MTLKHLTTAQVLTRSVVGLAEAVVRSSQLRVWLRYLHLTCVGHPSHAGIGTCISALTRALLSEKLPFTFGGRRGSRNDSDPQQVRMHIYHSFNIGILQMAAGVGSWLK